MREEQDIKSFLTGVCAASVIERSIDIKNFISFIPFSSQTIDTILTSNNNSNLQNRIANLQNENCRKLLSESLKSNNAQTCESSYRNILNMMENSENIINNGKQAKHEISFMEAVSSDHNLDIEGKHINEISNLIAEERLHQLKAFHAKIDLYEMFGTLSHIFFSEYQYREKYKDVLEKNAKIEELVSITSKLTSDNFNLLTFFATSRNSCKESLFDYIGDGLKEIALEYRKNLLSNDKEMIKKSLIEYNSAHRKLLNNTYILSDDIVEYRNNLTINANIFFYCREYANIFLSEGLIEKEKQVKLNEVSLHIDEQSLKITKEILDLMGKNLTALLAAIDNADIIQNIENFAQAAINNNMARMNNILSELPSIVSDDLIKISDIRLSYLSNISDKKILDRNTGNYLENNKPDSDKADNNTKEFFIQKIINAIPKGDPRRELIRQQLLKQFGLIYNKFNKQDAITENTIVHKKEAHEIVTEPKNRIERPNPAIPNPQDDHVCGFELQNNAFNVRNGGIRLEGNTIIFTPNKNITEILIPAATISILTQTDPDKPLLIEGNNIKGLSMINTKRSDVLHVKIQDNMLVFITTKGKKVLSFRGIEVFRIHSSTQADGWYLNKQNHVDIENEVKIVFNHINEQRLKTLKPSYSSDILSFQDKK